MATALAAAVSAMACTMAPRTPRADGPPGVRSGERPSPPPEQLRTREAASYHGIVVTGSAEASWAGMRMLEDGGNAVDAAVAAALALGVAEPGSSGLGGATYMLIRMADGRAAAIDGSVRAPLRVSLPELADLRETTRLTLPGFSLYGWKTAATPGTPAALDLALRRFGSRTLGEVVAPAIAIAEFGSRWTPAQHTYLEHYVHTLRESAYLSRLLLKDAVEVWDEGHVYCNPDAACFLRRLVGAGVDAFYRGDIADEIVADMAASGGWLRRADLASMEATEREPLRGRYRGMEVLSFPHPGGGAAVVEALGILDRFPAALLRGDTVDRLHLLVEACRLASADTLPYLRPRRPPDTVAVDPEHVAARAASIRFDRALWAREVYSDPLSRLATGGTTQVSTADRFGNVVSLTQTLGATFGAKVATAGFGWAYNSLVDGFEYSDPRAWAYLRPLQPPTTSMAPTILVADGRPVLLLGSAGSSRIPAAIVGCIVAHVDRGLPIGEAVGFPRVLWGGAASQVVAVELAEPITEAQADSLLRRGFVDQERIAFPATVRALLELGAVNAIAINPRDGRMVGAADPRRQGVALAAREGAAVEPLPLPECWREEAPPPGA